MSLSPDIVRQASVRAAEILSGMGYTGKYGSTHLLKLKLQNNTITAVLHNMIAWQIGELDKRWTFKPKGGATADLVDKDGNGIQVKATSNTLIKGNKVSKGEGYYVAVKYEREEFSVKIREILMGSLKSSDWQKPEGTQLAILTKEAEGRLSKIYP